MSFERLYLVAYDISDPKRLKKVASLLEGYGYRIQLSVFICRLTPARLEVIRSEISAAMNTLFDQCLFVDLGTNLQLNNNVSCIGRRLKNIPNLTII